MPISGKGVTPTAVTTSLELSHSASEIILEISTLDPFDLFTFIFYLRLGAAV